MREKVGERGREGGKHGGKKFKSNPEVVGYRNNIDRTTSYFITNFPPEITASDLWKLFSRYWRVGEVYIPDKLDKAGKRFGFARFEDVKDRQLLLKKIEDTWIGTYKIRANLPKFSRGEGDVKTNSRRPEFAGPRGEQRQGTGKSFKEVVLGGNKSNPNNQKGWVVKNNDKGKKKLTEAELKAGIMAIDAEPQILKKLEGSYVGTLQQIADVDCIQTTLWMEGFQHITATHMGMNLILLNSSVEGEIQRAYEANKPWWERWFLSVTPWRPYIRPRGRRIWVRLFGVPLHIWSWEGFKKIIWRYGTLLNLDPETLDHSRFDVARAQITVNYWEMVDETIEVKVDEEVFIIRMIEERFGSVDLGRDKVAGSRNGVGESEADSVSRVEEVWSMLGVEEGWSEKGYGSGESVNDDEGNLNELDTSVINHGSVEKSVTIESHGERENLCQTVGGKEAAKGVGTEMAGTDGDMVYSKKASSGSFCSVVMETALEKEQNKEGGSHFLENGIEGADIVGLRGDKVVVGEDKLDLVENNGPNLIMGPSACVDLLGQRKGKAVIVVEENNKKTLKGSTSLWASKEVGLGQIILIDENSEFSILKDKEVALLAEIEERGG
jgi:hypothetical protein